MKYFIIILAFEEDSSGVLRHWCNNLSNSGNKEKNKSRVNTFKCNLGDSQNFEQENSYINFKYIFSLSIFPSLQDYLLP